MALIVRWIITVEDRSFKAMDALDKSIGHGFQVMNLVLVVEILVSEVTSSAQEFFDIVTKNSVLCGEMIVVTADGRRDEFSDESEVISSSWHGGKFKND